MLQNGGINYTVKVGDTLSRICVEHPELGYTKWQDLRDENIEEISRVNREQMAALGIAANISRIPCGIKGHSLATKHFISDGIHYDGKGQPTIYPGTTFFLKEKSPIENIEDEAAEEAEAAAKVEEQAPPPAAQALSTNEISKGAFSQCPNPRIELYEFKDNNLSCYLTYDGLAQDTSKQLLSYEFSEAVDDVKGSFSFTVENEEDNDSTIFDKIKLRTIVYIYEGDDKKAVFVGIVRQKSIASSMQAAGPRKTITFSGCSIMGLVADFVLSLDIKIMNVSDAEIASMALTIKLMEAETIMDFINLTADHYISLTMKNFKMNDCETVKILKALTNGTLDIFTYGTHDSKLSYDISNAFYSQGKNNLVDMWRNMLPNPVYEIYGYCHRDGGIKIMVRESPFDAETWAALRITKIEPISLKSYSLQQSDEEVYTFFNCWLEGSAKEHDFYTVVNQWEGEESAMAIDPIKLARYGYRPLEIAFRGYDRSQNIKEQSSSLTSRFKALNERAARWYSRLDDMFSGNITIVTNFSDPQRNPRVGEKVAFLGGEFYVRSATHSWNYGGNPAINLSVSRGMVYNNGAAMAGDAGILSKLGGERREILE